VTGGYADPSPMRRLVVGVDGSRGSATALRWAIGAARLSGGEVVAIHCLDRALVHGPFMTLGPPPPRNVPSSWYESVRAHVKEEWTSALHQSGLEHRSLIYDGPPGPTLVGAAEELQADTIVVGTRGRGGLAERVLGSVSHHVAHHAGCVVVVVPPSESVGDGDSADKGEARG
jgi:nucleotide-binding universal stress UspA family protein